jgi:hypothetical protein
MHANDGLSSHVTNWHDLHDPKHGPHDDLMGVSTYVMSLIGLRHLLDLSTSTISNEHMTQMQLHTITKVGCDSLV